MGNGRVIGTSTLMVSTPPVSNLLLRGLSPVSKGEKADRELDYGNRPVREVVDEAWQRIRQFNAPRRLFERGGQLVRIVHEETGIRVERLDDNALHNLLHTAADWKKNGNHATTIPKDIVRTLKGESDPPLPELESVHRTPVFLDDGTLHTEPGYDPESGFFLHLQDEAELPEIPEDPTQADVENAVKLLRDKLQDFPFATATDETHAFAMLLEPFVRPMIDGPTPLYLVEAEQSGTGKTCLVDTCGLVSVGRTPPSITEGESDGEWRKRITSTLLAAPRMVKIDNVNDKLDSGSLASALTTETWSDRRLGESETVEMPVNCTWVATANNPTYSDEIGRRIVSIRLTPDHPNPRRRDPREFAYPNLLNHVKENRGEHIGACLTIIQAWVSQGCPEYDGKPFPSYIEWSQVLGGILQVAGMPAFLNDRDRVEASIEDEHAQLKTLLGSIHDEVGEDPWTIGDVFENPTVETVAKEYVGKQETGSAKRSLGKLLSNENGTTFGRIRLENAGKDRHRDVNQYKIRQLDSSTASAGSAGSAGNPEALPSDNTTNTPRSLTRFEDTTAKSTSNTAKTPDVEDTETEPSPNPANPAKPANEMSGAELFWKSLKGVFTLRSDE